jgi:hypothetical protein
VRSMGDERRREDGQERRKMKDRGREVRVRDHRGNGERRDEQHFTPLASPPPLLSESSKKAWKTFVKLSESESSTCKICALSSA